LAYLHKIKKGLAHDKDVMEKEIETLKRKINLREESLEDDRKTIGELKDQLVKKENDIAAIQS